MRKLLYLPILLLCILFLPSVSGKIPEDTTFVGEKKLLKEAPEVVQLTFEYPNVEWNTYKIDIYSYDVLKMKDSFYVDMSRAKFPVIGRITSHFGFRGAQYHYGTDIKLQTGDSVYAVFDGIVRVVRYDRGGYGKFIVIAHDNGLETLYGHLSTQNVKPGQRVKAGEFIGKGGNTGRSTGSHLHFEFRFMGEQFNPYLLMDFETGTLKKYALMVKKDLFNYMKELRKARYVRVRRGDSLWVIARRNHTTVSRLCRLNGISRNRTLYPGQRIRVR